MSLKQMMANDLDVFYNSDEFATTAIYKTVSLSVLFEDDIELQSAKQIAISAKSSDVIGLDVGDTFEIDGVTYEVINYEPKDKYNLEMLIAMESVA